MKNIAIVTGASSGMGRETARQLAKRFPGLDEIWVIARREERLQELKKRLEVPARVLALDLTDDAALGQLRELLANERPAVRFLVNASGFGKIGPVEAGKLSELTGMIDVNCRALTAVTRLVLPYMGKNGRIIQYASSAAFLPQPGFAVYAATKAYVLSFSRALNHELRGQGIRVTAVCPGPVRTEFFEIAETTGVIPLYKRLVMARPERVVRKALHDSIAGRELSVYGAGMKAFRTLCKMVPHRLILEVMDRIEYLPQKRRG